MSSMQASPRSDADGDVTAGPSQEPAPNGRGLAWVIGSFALCPCHLPLTLGLLGTVAGGTAFGALLNDHVVLSAIVIIVVWALGLSRGLWLLRQPTSCPVPGARGRRSDRVRGFFGRPPRHSRATPG